MSVQTEDSGFYTCNASNVAGFNLSMIELRVPDNRKCVCVVCVCVCVCVCTYMRMHMRVQVKPASWSWNQVSNILLTKSTTFDNRVYLGRD